MGCWLDDNRNEYFVPLVGVAIGSLILIQGIKGKRLKEEREFRSFNGSD